VQELDRCAVWNGELGCFPLSSSLIFYYYYYFFFFFLFFFFVIIVVGENAGMERNEPKQRESKPKEGVLGQTRNQERTQGQRGKRERGERVKLATNA
jgi:hypothetical protein